MINDNGRGIPVEERRDVFRRFHRLEASHSMPGIRLGLALVTAIANLHGAEALLGDYGPGLRTTLRFATENGK